MIRIEKSMQNAIDKLIAAENTTSIKEKTALMKEVALSLSLGNRVFEDQLMENVRRLRITEYLSHKNPSNVKQIFRDLLASKRLNKISQSEDIQQVFYSQTSLYQLDDEKSDDSELIFSRGQALRVNSFLEDSLTSRNVFEEITLLTDEDKTKVYKNLIASADNSIECVVENNKKQISNSLVADKEKAIKLDEQYSSYREEKSLSHQKVLK